MALVDDGGVGVAVAEDDFSFGECGSEDAGDVVRAIGEEEEELGEGGEVFAVEEEVADGFAELAGTGLSGKEGGVAGLGDAIGEGAGEGGLAGSFGSFESDEHGGRILPCALVRAGLGWVWVGRDRMVGWV